MGEHLPSDHMKRGRLTTSALLFPSEVTMPATPKQPKLPEWVRRAKEHRLPAKVYA